MEKADFDAGIPGYCAVTGCENRSAVVVFALSSESLFKLLDEVELEWEPPPGESHNLCEEHAERLRERIGPRARDRSFGAHYIYRQKSRELFCVMLEPLHQSC